MSLLEVQGSSPQRRGARERHPRRAAHRGHDQRHRERRTARVERRRHARSAWTCRCLDFRRVGAAPRLYARVARLAQRSRSDAASGAPRLRRSGPRTSPPPPAERAGGRHLAGQVAPLEPPARDVAARRRAAERRSRSRSLRARRGRWGRWGRCGRRSAALG